MNVDSSLGVAGVTGTVVNETDLVRLSPLPSEQVRALPDVTVAQLRQALRRGTKVYRAKISQAGTAAPTVTVLENDFGAAIVWTRNSAGNYTGTLVGAFTLNKTFALGSLATAAAMGIARASADAVTVIVSGDDVLSNASLEIIVYP
jgi:hypothetical protein